MRHVVLTASIFCLLASKLLVAANGCSAEHSNSDRISIAESHEEHFPAAAQTTINPGVNGGIHIHGWDQPDVLVKACVHASASTESDAEALMKEIRIVRGSGDIEPEGPKNSTSRYWDLSYEIWMPKKSNIEAHGVNGGIAIESIEGEIRFQTVNGGVTLFDLAGDVDGSTQNGGLSIELNGSSWRGTGLRAETQNGGITLRVPEGYSAQVEASTVNGGMHVNFPVQLDGRSLSFNLGSGGAAIYTRTTNGGINITKI